MPAPLNVQQIALYMSKRRAGSRQEVAAAAAGISVSSAHRIDSGRLQPKAAKPRGRRRPDPLAEVWDPLLLPLLERHPALTPTTLLEHLQEQKPDQDWSSLKRTLQRRVQHWKALHGPVPEVMGAPEVKPLLSDEHFSVDGTLLQAWASHASLERIDGEEDPPPPPSGPGEGIGTPKPGKKRAKGDFRGIKLSNKTHRSGSDPDALLARKSKAHPAQPSYRGHVLMDNRHALIVDCRVTQAVGTGERDAAKEMAADVPGAHQKTLGADKNYDTKGFVAEMRRIGVTPHVAQNTSRAGGSAIDGRTTRHQGYAKSIYARRGIEKVFGWIKQWGGLRQFKLRGTEKVGAVFGLHVIAYNLIRVGNLLKPVMAAAGADGCPEVCPGVSGQTAPAGQNA